MPGYKTYETIYKNEISGITTPSPTNNFFENIQFLNEELVITSSGQPTDIMVRVYDLSGKLSDSIKYQVNSRVSRIKLKTKPGVISLVQLQKSNGETFNLKKR
ncbi:MAG: hypothetical protein Q8T08_18305 [Ignavibacteria bacterium]|nr:hypothetical protein [Ignavibacteria bacterium]